jgi:hypothetical protein
MKVKPYTDILKTKLKILYNTLCCTPTNLTANTPKYPNTASVADIQVFDSTLEMDD